MIPDWNTIRDAWPVVAGIALIWARFEVAISGTKAQSAANAAELAKLESKVDAQDRAAQLQAVQLATIVANSSAMKEQLTRMEDKLDTMGRRT